MVINIKWNKFKAYKKKAFISIEVVILMSIMVLSGTLITAKWVKGGQNSVTQEEQAFSETIKTAVNTPQGGGGGGYVPQDPHPWPDQGGGIIKPPSDSETAKPTNPPAVNYKSFVLVDGPTINKKLREIDAINQIKSIEFVDTVKPTTGVTEIFGLDDDNDGGVVGWYTGKGEVFISTQNHGQKVVANSNCSQMFAGDPVGLGFLPNPRLTLVSLINVEKLDVSNVNNMSSLFSELASGSEIKFIGLNTWNTSKVTDMSSMFYRVGMKGYFPFTLDLANFDISNVTEIDSMLYGVNANKIILPKVTLSSTVDISYVIGTDVWYDETDNYKQYQYTIPFDSAKSHTLVSTKPI